MPRSKPFSGKLKKLQLQAKRQSKKAREDAGCIHKNPVRTASTDSSESDESLTQSADLLSSSPPHRSAHASTASRKSKPANKNARDRYKLLFGEESKEEVIKRKERSMQPYSRKTPEEMEAGVGLFYDPPIMFPTRPPWNHSLSPAELDRKENQYFQKYSEDFLRNHSLGYYELNLETWRQLWRVFEMSDVLLHIIDVRFAALHFNPALYEYIAHKLDKQVIVILNKCDIVPAEVAIAWKHYLLNTFPKLEVVIFTSFPKDEVTRDALSKGKQSHRKRKRAPAVGPMELWTVLNTMLKHVVKIDSWKEKILEDMKISASDDGACPLQPECEAEIDYEKHTKADFKFSEHTKYKDGVLTIGCVGYPNVGKSSVINSLMGHKVVSISKTPGHTKHFQTIFLTSNVMLCDCPGLVFPSTAPRAIQVLAGMYPVAQLKEPYSVVQYLAEGCDLPACLGIKLPADERQWSAAYLICDELAELKGFKTGRGARTDPYRAANWILRASLEGKMYTYFLPPDFNKNIDYWKNHTDTLQLRETQVHRLQTAEYTSSAAVGQVISTESESSSDEEETTTINTNPFQLLTDS